MAATVTCAVTQLPLSFLCPIHLLERRIPFLHFLQKIQGERGVEARKAAKQRMDKSSSLVIDPPDGGCRVSFGVVIVW